jgi:hypothetical protein
MQSSTPEIMTGVLYSAAYIPTMGNNMNYCCLTGTMSIYGLYLYNFNI